MFVSSSLVFDFSLDTVEAFLPFGILNVGKITDLVNGIQSL